MKNTHFFPHDYGARNDDKIIKLRARFNNPWGYGLYWMFIESMHETTDGYIDSTAIAEFKLSFGLANEELMQFIKFCIDEHLFILENDSKITTKRVQEHKEFRQERSESGKKGVEIRENKRKLSSASCSASNQLHAKKRKEKKENNKVFIPPTIEEVTTYQQQRNSIVIPTSFIDFYASKGWMVGKNKMKDWKAAFRNAEGWDRWTKPQIGKDKWNDLN